MDSASSSASSSPAFRSTVFKHLLLTPQQRYKQQQLHKERMMADATDRVQRDRMARGKDPYCDSDEEASGDAEQAAHSGPNRYKFPGAAVQEDFASKERREKAITYLSNPELLMMYAQSTNDSVAGARLHFMKMMCGYDERSVAERNARENGMMRMEQLSREADRRRGGGERASGRQVPDWGNRDVPNPGN